MSTAPVVVGSGGVHGMTTAPAEVAPFKSIGHGGRSSISGIHAAVFGSTGFLGRYVVNELGRVGSLVVMPTRCSDNHRQHLRLMGDLGQLHFMDFDVRDEDDIKRAVEGANVVVNLIGRDYFTYNWSFESVHIEAAERIARLSKEAGVSKFIHLSALGASTSHPSKFMQTKALGEEAVLNAFPTANIVRPAKLAGVEDRFLNPYATFSQASSFFPLIDGGDAKVQPVLAEDLGIAIGKIVQDPEAVGKVYEFGGPKVYTMKEIKKLLSESIRERPYSMMIPHMLSKAMTMPRDIAQTKFPLPLFAHPAFNTDWNAQLTEDVVVDPNTKALTFESLNMEPRELKGMYIDYLRSYRSGGYDFGTTAGEN